MMDLTGEVSSGAVDMANGNLEKMLKLCATPLPQPQQLATTEETVAAEQKYKELKAIQEKSLHEVRKAILLKGDFKKNTKP